MTNVIEFNLPDSTPTNRITRDVEPCADMPNGYYAMRDGIYISVETAEGSAEEQFLCSPLRVLALVRDGAGSDWGRLVEVTDPDMQKHEIVVFDNQFAGSGAKVMGPLLSAGLRLAPGRDSKKALIDLLQGWEPAQRYALTNRLGWPDAKCTSFVLCDGSVIGDQSVKLRSGTFTVDLAAMKSAGDLSSWRTHVAAPCMGNPLLITAVSMAFAAPMLELLGIDGGGLHLRGRSSCGKSTIQAVAVSVWGDQKFRKSWNATANGLEGIACNHNGLLLALDELGEISGIQLDKAVYALSNGQGKSRMQSNSTMQPTSHWRVMILSSGEISIADKIGESGKKCMEGHEVRLVDITSDSRQFGAFDDLHGDLDGDVFAKRLMRATAANHGVAGSEFVVAMISKKENFRKVASNIMSNFQEAAERLPGYIAHGQISRVMTRFALVAAAGEIASKLNLTGWPAAAAKAAVLDVFAKWLEGGLGAKSASVRAATDRTRAYLQRHGATGFEDLTVGGSSLSVSERLGWQDANLFYIPSDTWRQIHDDHDSAQTARDHDASGFLLRGDGDNLMSKAPAGISGRPRLYRLRKSILTTQQKIVVSNALKPSASAPT